MEIDTNSVILDAVKPFSSREDVIWAAGLFEGEGWFSVQGKGVSLGMQLSDKDLLIRLQHILGCGNIYYRPPRIYSYETIKTRKSQWAWRVTSFEYVQAVIAYMWPWLSHRRQERAKEILALGRSGVKRRPRNTHAKT
jgi:hypothetical protein